MYLRAQVSIEHSALLAIVMSILVVGFFYLSDITQDYQGYAFRALSDSEGNKLVDAITKSPHLGSQGKQRIVLDLPEEFQQAYLVGDNILVFELSTPDGTEHLLFVSPYTIIDDNAITNLVPGKHQIYVTTETNGVCISEDGYCGAECGDGIASISEECDLADLKGRTCIDFGYSGGVLTCWSNCSGFDEVLCN